MGGLKKIFVVFFILSLVSCGGGGGKGGGGSGGGGGTTACSYRGSDYSGCYPARYSTSTYETTEYKNQYGLSSINASSAYSRELDGSGVKVGVFDTGINPNHAEFTGKTISGWDYEGDDSTLSDGDGHGSHVAGIIAARKDGSSTSKNMHGVAYGVTNLYIYKIINDSGAATDGDWETDIPNAISKAISAGVQVINHSYALVQKGGSQEINDRTKSSWESSYGDRITAYKSLATNKIINVFAAGNSGNLPSASGSPLMEAGLPYYYSELEDYWIAVINVDSNGKETLLTNRCGVAADWCIAAPGYRINSVDNDGGYIGDTAAKGYYDGTSMAAPHVAGAVAILIGTFPTLSAAQIVDRILNTAKTTGLTDYNDNGYSAAVFGHGLLDLDAATKPIEVLALSVGGTNIDNSKRYTLNSTRLNLSKVFGQNTLANRIINRTSNFSQQVNSSMLASFDTYDNAVFFIDMGSLTTQPVYSSFTYDAFLLKDIEEEVMFNIGNLQIYGIVMPYDSDTDIYNYPFKNIRAELQIDNDVGFKFNYSESAEFYFLSKKKQHVIESLYTYDAFNNPYIGLNGESFSLEGNYKLTKNLLISLLYESEQYIQELEINYDERKKVSTIKGVNMEFESEKGDKVSIFLASMSEEDSFLGSKASGAFKLEDDSKTNIFGMSLDGHLGELTQLSLQAFYGITEVDPHEQSLFEEFQKIESFSWSIGVLHNELLNKNDSIGLIVHQPIRAEDGSLTLSVPLYTDYKGNIYPHYEKYDLEPEGRELNYEMFYEINPGIYKIKFTSLFIQDGGHLSSNPLEKVFMFELRGDLGSETI